MIPVVLILLIIAADNMLPSAVHLGPLLTVAPALAALFAGPRVTALVGICALLALVFVDRLRGGLTTLNHEVQISALVAITAFVVAFCLLRERHERELAQVRSVAEAAQQVVLRPVPDRVGPLRLAAVYLAAAAEAQIGGDLYAAARTGGATRLLIGDVRGKGLEAISEAGVVLCAFHEAAPRRDPLPCLVTLLETSLVRGAPADAEFFVTAALAEVPDDEPVVRLVSCGHPPPLLLRGREVRALRVDAPGPPLGIGLVAADHEPATFPYEPGDLLVLYTDGVIEARDRTGAFYPLAARLGAWRGGDPSALVEYIRTDLLEYVGGRLPDDAAIVVAERSVGPG